MSIPDELTQPVELDVSDAIDLLCNGDLTVEGRLMDASNATLYCAITANGVTAACVYKPVAGERPLWDFPDGSLAQREVAAYEVSATIGWEIVPPTIYRDGPAGPGMVQLWIAEDAATELMPLIRRRDVDALRRIAVYDAVINNADRKGGHLLPIQSGHVYGVDHGVSFHVEDKLRTVLWQWAGARLTDDALDMLGALRAQLEGQLCERLGELLTRRELRRTIRRVEDLLSTGRHPRPGEDWPAVPWPPI
jgi:uncharacterized repeat protein (TIGR03843 family)